MDGPTAMSAAVTRGRGGWCTACGGFVFVRCVRGGGVPRTTANDPERRERISTPGRPTGQEGYLNWAKTARNWVAEAFISVLSCRFAPLFAVFFPVAAFHFYPDNGTSLPSVRLDSYNEYSR